MASLQCSVLTPEGPVFEGAVESVAAVGADGEIGILPNHAPLITALGSGDLRVRQDGKVQHWLIMGGFLEVLKNKVVVLAHKLEHLDDIDVDQAKRDIDQSGGNADDKAAARARVRYANKYK